jgi:hypothetical protein
MEGSCEYAAVDSRKGEVFQLGSRKKSRTFQNVTQKKLISVNAAVRFNLLPFHLVTKEVIKLCETLILLSCMGVGPALLHLGGGGDPGRMRTKC